MNIKINDNNDLLTIERDGYNPVTFAKEGDTVRVVHGVAFKGDHDLVEEILLGGYVAHESGVICTNSGRMIGMLPAGMGF